MWRPKGWIEQKKYKCDLNWSGALDSHFQPATLNEARYYIGGYEDGADAILEALKHSEQSHHSAKGDIIPGGATMIMAGTWVFIPDEGGLK